MQIPTFCRTLAVCLFVLLGFSALPSPGGKISEAQMSPTPPYGVIYPFPAGYDYPQPAATVQNWVANRNSQSIRQHGWNLWAGLNQLAPNGRPVWRSWWTATQAFASNQAGATQAVRRKGDPRPLTLNARNNANAATTDAEPINFPSPPYYPVPAPVRQKYPQCYNAGLDQNRDGQVFQNNGDIMVAAVVYSDSAFKWIRNQNLYLASKLTSLLPATPTSPPNQITPMPPGSVALKVMLWPVQATGFTALPVWDDLPPSADGGKYVGYEIQSKWSRAMAVTPLPPPGGIPQTVTYLNGVYQYKGGPRLGPNTYTNAPITPLSAFYSLKFSAQEFAALSPCDRALLDQSAYWTYGRAFGAQDSLALIAMHIMTKEQPNWTFQSIWWHDQPTQGRYAGQRPTLPNAKGPWDHYLMTSTYGMQQLPGRQNNWPTPFPAGAQKWPVAYNPYIELAATHPIATNCMNCHHRAAWPPVTALQPAPPPPIFKGRSSNYLAAGTQAPDSLDVFQMNNPIFNGLLTVDSMWAVSDRAVYDPLRVVQKR